MRYWLTTHWPNPVSHSSDAAHYGVYLPDGKIAAAGGIERGDLVFVYETLTGKITVERYADGTTKRTARHRGRQGIVGLLKVLDRPAQPADSKTTAYSDGTNTWWRYVAPTESVNSAGFVPRSAVASILGLSPGYMFKGFGKLNSGLGEITQTQFEQLRTMYEQAAEHAAHKLDALQNAKPKLGVGGEGPIHRALKEAVAADPSTVLAEEGLTLWEKEFVLPTNDRVDIVLKDRFGRFVVVEIEPDCAAEEIVGPMQCVKYRALIGFHYKRPISEVRALLVAPSIHADVRRLCEGHSISCVEITEFPSV